MTKKMTSESLFIYAFFQNSQYQYRSFQLRDGIDTVDVESLISRAKGKANLRRRFYAISKPLANALNKMTDETIEWDFQKYFYQIGLVRDSGAIPDGFLLAQLSAFDGTEIRVVAAENPYDIEPLKQFIDLKKLLNYDRIFLSEDVFQHVRSVFPSMEDSSFTGSFFELIPMLRGHADYYRKNHKLNF